MDDETMAERLRAVERALTDGEPPDGLAERAALSGRVDGVEGDVADVEARLQEVEAAVEALRGYVGDVRNVNRDVERRADSALAKVERMESGGHRRADPLGQRDRGASDAAGAHPVPDPTDTEASLRERIAAWL